MSQRLRAVLVSVAVVAAGGLVAPTSSAAPPPEAQRDATVVSYNLYLGANLQPLFGATSYTDLVQRAGKVYADVERTNFPERAEALADQIAGAEPDVVGLQEVALWETGPAGGTLTPSYDFLDILLTELDERGLAYRPVASNENFTGQLPISLTTEARFTDRDVILARSDLPASSLRVSGAQSHNFTTQLQVPTSIGLTFEVPRGWSAVDVTVRGKTFRFANTHLEAWGEPIRNAQATELLAALEDSPYPVVLVGDLNSTPSDATGAYGMAQAEGYDDAWTAVHGPEGGFTSGQTDALNEPSKLDHRIDYVLYEPDGIEAVDAEVLGDEDADRTPSGLWPSDHAGVAAILHIAQP